MLTSFSQNIFVRAFPETSYIIAAGDTPKLRFGERPQRVVHNGCRATLIFLILHTNVVSEHANCPDVEKICGSKLTMSAGKVSHAGAMTEHVGSSKMHRKRLEESLFHAGGP